VCVCVYIIYIIKYLSVCVRMRVRVSLSVRVTAFTGKEESVASLGGGELEGERCLREHTT
jgi:hypothetical protein